MLPLILYDVLSELPGKTWSPNPAKPRFVLGYKNLPFNTVWVEHCDIETTLKAVGAPPDKLPDGREKYDVPVLSDPNTGAIVTDHWEIAAYLDKTYPEKPVFPPGTKGLFVACRSALSAVGGDSFKFPLLRSLQILNERSAESFVRASAFGKYEEWSPEGPTRDAHWELIEKFYNNAKTLYDKEGGKWLMGDIFSYGDIILVAHVGWLKRVFRDDEWKRIASLHDGKWEKFLADVEKECNISYENAH